jgi:hypothetical protein
MGNEISGEGYVINLKLRMWRLESENGKWRNSRKGENVRGCRGKNSIGGSGKSVGDKETFTSEWFRSGCLKGYCCSSLDILQTFSQVNHWISMWTGDGHLFLEERKDTVTQNTASLKFENPLNLHILYKSRISAKFTLKPEMPEIDEVTYLFYALIQSNTVWYSVWFRRHQASEFEGTLNFSHDNRSYPSPRSLSWCFVAALSEVPYYSHKSWIISLTSA